MIGVILSLLTSAAMNLFANRAAVTSLSAAVAILNEQGTRMSVIPPWLALFALLFSALIGLGSGYYPANKAVRIPAHGGNQT